MTERRDAPRRNQIVELKGAGMTMEEIAYTLIISPRTVGNTLHHAYNGRKCIATVITGIKDGSLNPQHLVQDINLIEINSLTSRELEVLSKISEGMTNKELAASLTISLRTAKNHISNILEKLGTRNRVHAAVVFYVWQQQITTNPTTSTSGVEV